MGVHSKSKLKLQLQNPNNILLHFNQITNIPTKTHKHEQTEWKKIWKFWLAGWIFTFSPTPQTPLSVSPSHVSDIKRYQQHHQHQMRRFKCVVTDPPKAKIKFSKVATEFRWSPHTLDTVITNWHLIAFPINKVINVQIELKDIGESVERRLWHATNCSVSPHPAPSSIGDGFKTSNSLSRKMEIYASTRIPMLRVIVREFVCVENGRSESVFVVKFIARLSTINWTIYYLPSRFSGLSFFDLWCFDCFSPVSVEKLSIFTCVSWSRLE